MKKRLLLIIVAIFALIGVFALCSGCNATPVRRAYYSVDAATDVIQGVNVAYRAGLLTPAQMQALAPYVDAVHAAQDRVDTALLTSSSSVSVADAMQALTDAVITLADAKAKATRAGPATRFQQPQ